MSKNCDICGQKVGLLNGYKIADGIICKKCTELCPTYKTETTKDIIKYKQINDSRINIFHITQELHSLMSRTITIDNNNNLFFFGKGKQLSENPFIYSFDEVTGYEKKIEGQYLETTKSGGITRAIVGNIVAGPVGAIVGASTSSAQTRQVGGKEVYYIYFNIPSGECYVKFDAMEWNQFPKGFIGFLNKCIESNRENKSLEINNGELEEKFKELDILRNKKIITEDEYQKKRQDLLNNL